MSHGEAMSTAGELFKHLAQEAGVSPSTVTMALQDSPRIRAETKERVFRASRKVGYRASKIKGNHHLNFAVLYGQANPDQTLSVDVDVGIWEGISRRAVEMDISLFTQNFLPKSEKTVFADLPRLLRRDQCDGVFLMGTYYESFILRYPAACCGDCFRPLSYPVACYGVS